MLNLGDLLTHGGAAGIFANFAFTLLVPPPPTAGSVTGPPDGTNQIIVLDENQFQAFVGFAEDEDRDKEVERLMTCR